MKLAVRTVLAFEGMPVEALKRDLIIELEIGLVWWPQHGKFLEKSMHGMNPSKTS